MTATTTKFEKTLITFESDVFAPVAVADAKTPYCISIVSVFPNGQANSVQMHAWRYVWTRSFSKTENKISLKKYPDACGRRLKLKKNKKISHGRFLSQILSSRVPRNRERSYVFRWICRTTESPSVKIKELAVTHRLFWI